ncbi:MAG: fluoride efflux transporter CrcB [Bacteroidales bacterium]|nr:fluoride efflux transporter CrcB [Bacteroidales bacterium]
MKVLLLLAGGAIGTLARYSLSGLAHKIYDGVFPLGTLVVNLAGSLLIGLLWGLLDTGSLSTHTRAFIFIGIFGGFTTFSTYTLESLNLFKDGDIKLAVINILANNILGLLLVFIGFVSARGLLNVFR